MGRGAGKSQLLGWLHHCSDPWPSANYRRFQIFVPLSKKEGLGMILSTSQSCGAPGEVRIPKCFENSGRLFECDLEMTWLVTWSPRVADLTWIIEVQPRGWVPLFRDSRKIPTCFSFSVHGCYPLASEAVGEREEKVSRFPRSFPT